MNGGAVWLFDGEEGHCEILAALVRRQIESLESVLPDEYADPIDRLLAEFDGDLARRVEADPSLARLFPPALADADQAATFRRDALVQQARTRLAAANKVLAAVESVTDCEVPVALEDIDAWVMTMAGLRAQWNVELTGSGERLAEAKHRDMLRHPTAAAVTDWLAYQIEAALEARDPEGGSW